MVSALFRRVAGDGVGPKTWPLSGLLLIKYRVARYQLTDGALDK
jgi:hypothetical protein